MNKIHSTLAATAIGTAVALTPVAAAQAHDNNDQPCVTPHEYEHVTLDDYRPEVHDRFDFNGSEVWQEDGREKRHYKVCDWVDSAYGPVPDGFYDVYVWYAWDGVGWNVYRTEWCGGPGC